MNDPYRVLNISSGATDEEVQDAYRKLLFQYQSTHDDENIAKLNAAYDEIMAQRRGFAGYNNADNTYSSPYTEADPAQTTYQTVSEFSDIRRLLQNRRISDAQELLDGVPERSRNGEWYFLRGSVCYERGYLDRAYDYFFTATQMDPANQEYASAFRMVSQQASGSYQGQPYGYGSSVFCNYCTSMMCINCCCNCMGGGC